MSIILVRNRVETLLDVIKKSSVSPEEKLRVIQQQLEGVRNDLNDCIENHEEPDEITIDPELYAKVREVVFNSEPNRVRSYYDREYMNDLQELSQKLVAKALLEFCTEHKIEPLKIWETMA